jgi:hypothetical protein
MGRSVSTGFTWIEVRWQWWPFTKRIMKCLLDIALVIYIGLDLLDNCLKVSEVFDKLTVEIVLPEDGTDDLRNALEYKSNSVTWCMKETALIIVSIKAKLKIKCHVCST